MPDRHSAAGFEAVIEARLLSKSVPICRERFDRARAIAFLKGHHLSHRRRRHRPTDMGEFAA